MDRRARNQQHVCGCSTSVGLATHGHASSDAKVAPSEACTVFSARLTANVTMSKLKSLL